MNTTFVANTSLTTITCGECGGIYAICERYRTERQRDGNGWHCPYCQCSWGYFTNGENAKLKKEVESLQASVVRLKTTCEYHQKESEHFRKSRDAVKGVVTKIKKRVGNGVCPCCQRAFPNLKAHMENKHPAYRETPPSCTT